MKPEMIKEYNKKTDKLTSGVNLFLPHLKPKFEFSTEVKTTPDIPDILPKPSARARKLLISSVLDNKSKHSVSALVDDPRHKASGINSRYKIGVKDMVKLGQQGGMDEFGLEGFPSGKYPTFDAK